MCVIIFCTIPSNSFEIWLWIYICHLYDVHCLKLLIVEYLYPIIFSAIAPPAWSKCAPIMSGSTPLSCSLRGFEVVLTALKMSLLLTSVHDSLRQTSQRIFSSITVLLRMCCTLRARSDTDPVLPFYLWFKVYLIIYFIEFEF